MSEEIIVGGYGEGSVPLKLEYANRHGLIAGATGTGKTVTVQVLAEEFSRRGVPVFVSDVKGDLSGLGAAGKPHPKISERVDYIKLADYSARSFPVRFWDVLGKNGTPVRLTVSEMGPQLLSRLLDLNDAQESLLALVFSFADQEGMLLLDVDDLKTTLDYLSEHANDLQAGYGNISKASINAIQRKLLMFEGDGGDTFFGEPAIQLENFFCCDSQGNGVVNVFDARSLSSNQRIYTAFLLWLLSEMFESLPERGEADRPIAVFFFDEAHLLFKGTPKIFLEKIEQVIRLIRSKGVGIYFISQSPADIPDEVLGQLGNRFQHALRAYTPKERKAVRVAAQSFRENPALDTETVIGELGVGEALVSVLGDKGVPSIVQRTLIRPPASRIGPLSDIERASYIQKNPYESEYRQPVDRVSAHELLLERAKKRQQQEELAAGKKVKTRASGQSRSRETVGEAFMKSMARSLGSASGRRILRGVLGSILKGK